MAMTTRQLVDTLQKSGHQVTYRIRKDGGVLITSIDGQSFKGATGNKVARFILGETISQRRMQQLTTITHRRKQKRTTPWPETPDALEKMRKRVMRKWRKTNLRGSISKRNLQRMIEDRGIEGAAEYLYQMERRTEGYAHPREIEGLLARIEQDKVNASEDDVQWLDALYNLIDQKRDYIKQEWIPMITDKLYDWEQDSKGIISAHDVYLVAKSLIDQA